MRFFTALIAICLSIAGLAVQAQKSPKNGSWRGTFTLANGQESPFNFELQGKTAYLLNGSERFELKGITQSKDSLFIPIDIYDAVLAAKIIDPNSLSGVFKKFNTAKPDKGIEFTAEFGKKYRFFESPSAAGVSLQGNWDVVIGEGGNKIVGVFSQFGNKLTGTFLTTTGDYRYLEGSVQGNEFYLSAFSGSNPLLIRGKVTGDDLSGEYINVRGSQPIKGIRNDKAALPDAYTLTTIKEGTKFDFTFPDAFIGKPVSLKDPKYKGKAVIVTILGSWCPNCLDEAAFLAPWYKANRKRGVEIIGLSFERKNDPQFAKTRLEVLKKRFGIEYDILFAGLADKDFASNALPALSSVLSFPTTILIDKEGNVSKIHTGYTGPATGKYYEEFVKEFNRDIDEVLGIETTSAKPKQTEK
jgi:thiol-disulfide isomerase/thioredoxin